MIITEIPDWIAKFFIEFATLTYKGNNYQYAIVSQDLGLKNGMAANFTIAVEGVLAVSAACPLEYRDLYLIHELMEKEDTCQDHGCCLRSLQKEIDLAKEEDYDMYKYVRDRYDFFQGLSDYYKTRRNTPEGLSMSVKTARSLLYLKRVKMLVAILEKEP